MLRQRFMLTIQDLRVMASYRNQTARGCQQALKTDSHHCIYYVLVKNCFFARNSQDPAVEACCARDETCSKHCYINKNALSLPYFNTSKMSIEFSIRIQCCVYSWAPGNTSGRWCKRSKQRQSCGLCQNICLKQSKSEKHLSVIE